VDRGRLCQRSACSGHVACRDGSTTWAGEAPGQGASDTQTSARCAGSPSEIGSRLANASSRGVGEIRPTSLFALRGSSQYRAVHNQQFKGRLKEGTSSFTTEWQAFKWMSASCCRSLRTGQAALGQVYRKRLPGNSFLNVRCERRSRSLTAAGVGLLSTILQHSPGQAHRAGTAGAEAACSTNPVSRHNGIAITLLVALATPDQMRPDAPAPLAPAVQASAELRMQWPNPNTVHFVIRIAADTSIRVVGCGVRGRNG